MKLFLLYVSQNEALSVLTAHRMKRFWCLMEWSV